MNNTEAREIFFKAMTNYLNKVENKLNNDFIIPASSGTNYTTRNNLQGATWAEKAFSNEEIEEFYKTYDELWTMGAYIEAYCLLRMTFGVLTKSMIDKLYRQGHLLNSFGIYNYARNQ